MKKANITVAKVTPEQRFILLSVKRHSPEPYRPRRETWVAIAVFYAAAVIIFQIVRAFL